jgi:hypothetical protein
VGIEMAEVGQSFLSPQPPVPLFAVGDMVHVFEGTGVGKEGLRNVGWFGKVVGREGSAFLVEGECMKLQKQILGWNVEVEKGFISEICRNKREIELWKVQMSEIIGSRSQPKRK